MPRDRLSVEPIFRFKKKFRRALAKHKTLLRRKWESLPIEIIEVPRKKKILPQKPTELCDRVQVYKWKTDCAITRAKAQSWACKSERTAKRHGLSMKHTRTWFNRWYDYEPQEDVTNGQLAFRKRTGKNGSMKYSKAFKLKHIRRFVNANNIGHMSRKDYCRENNLSNASLGRWLKKYTDIKPYEYRRVCNLLYLCICSTMYVIFAYNLYTRRFLPS